MNRFYHHILLVEVEPWVQNISKTVVDIWGDQSKLVVVTCGLRVL